MSKMRDALVRNVLGPVECERYARSITNKHGLSVKVSEDVECPMTDGKTIFLPKLKNDMTDDDIIRFKTSLLHESLHITEGQEFLDWAKGELDSGKTFNPNFHTTLNIVEDHRIERKGAHRYPGDGMLFDEGTRIIFENITESMAKNKAEGDPQGRLKDEGFQKTMALMAVDSIARTGWQPQSGILIDGLLESMPDSVMTYVDALMKADIATKIQDADTPEDVVAVSKEAFKILWPEDDPTPPKGKGEGKGEGKDGKGKGGEESEGAKAAKKMGRSEHKFTKDGKHGKVKYEGTVPMSEAGEREGEGHSVDYNDWAGGGEFVLGNTFVRDYSVDRSTSPSHAHGCARYIDECNPSESRISNRVRVLLQSKSAVRWQNGYRSGSVSKKSLYKVGVPTIGNGDWNSKVFKRKEQDVSLDTSVTYLGDFSGSMTGHKVATSINCGRMLANLLTTTLKMPCEILGFSESSHPEGYGTIVGVLKGFNEPLIRDGELVTRSKDFVQYMNQNADGVAVQVAWERLLRQPSKRKILVVGSDGCPCSSMEGDSDKFLKDTVKAIEKDGRVEIYGIGIQDDNVKRFYKHNQVIRDHAELENALVSVIRNFIINNGGK